MHHAIAAWLTERPGRAAPAAAICSVLSILLFTVLIVVAAEHRGPAFDACRYAIEELKARAPIWKQERYRDGSVWIGAPARHAPHEEVG